MERVQNQPVLCVSRVAEKLTSLHSVLHVPETGGLSSWLGLACGLCRSLFCGKEACFSLCFVEWAFCSVICRFVQEMVKFHFLRGVATDSTSPIMSCTETMLWSCACWRSTHVQCVITKPPNLLKANVQEISLENAIATRVIFFIFGGTFRGCRRYFEGLFANRPYHAFCTSSVIFRKETSDAKSHKARKYTLDTFRCTYKLSYPGTMQRTSCCAKFGMFTCKRTKMEGSKEVVYWSRALGDGATSHISD